MRDKTSYFREIDALIASIREHEAIYTAMSGATTTYTCLMGLGQIFQDELEVFQMAGYRIDFLCDNDPGKWGREFRGYRCLSPMELVNYGDDVAVIITVSCYEEIIAQLKTLGLRHVLPSTEWMRDRCARFANLDWLPAARETMAATVACLADDLSIQTYLGTLHNKFALDRHSLDYAAYAVKDEEYFVDSLILPSRDEYFVDAGAYTGDTLAKLLDRTGGNLGHAYLFELNPGNFAHLAVYTASLPAPLREHVTAYNIGLWNELGEVNYAGVRDGFAITREKLETVKTARVDTLDHLLGDKKVTFIKMDIEGAEQPALAGARGLIQTQHPRLAICTYHNLEDMLRIPLVIHELCPDYRIHLRHHTNTRYGTICYAQV